MDQILMHEEQKKNVEALRKEYYKRHKGKPPLEMLEDGTMVQLTDPRAISLRIKEGRANEYDVKVTAQGMATLKDQQFDAQNKERVRQEKIMQFFPEAVKEATKLPNTPEYEVRNKLAQKHGEFWKYTHPTTGGE